MPHPDFPEWFGPGATIRDRQGMGWFVLGFDILYAPATGVIRLRPLDTARQINWSQDALITIDIDLPVFLHEYTFTGYMRPDGSLLRYGERSWPITMRTEGLRFGALLNIEGSTHHDGEWTVTHVDERRINLRQGRLSAEDLGDESIMQAEDDRIMDELHRLNEGPDDGGGPEEQPEDDPPDSRDLFPDPGTPVGVNQIWLLAQPNEGMWRVSWMQGITVNLENTRDQSWMSCTAPWLRQHGIRQQPPDPRGPITAQGQQMALGQIWRFPNHRGFGTMDFRIRDIDRQTGRIMLVDIEKGSGKRRYLTGIQIVTRATLVGDGLPRRTAYEHLLQDDLGDD